MTVQVPTEHPFFGRLEKLETGTPAVVPVDCLEVCPLDTFAALRRDMRLPFFLDSADGPAHIARYSLIGGNPFLTFERYG